MMNADFYYRDKIPVGVLGATGSVGQKFVELLSRHPWFELISVAASDRSVNKPYRTAVNWLMAQPLDPAIGELEVLPCEPNLPCKVVFSALDASVAAEIETRFARAGYIVITNARNHRLDPSVPLIVPEINAGHLDLLKKNEGAIIANPNCCVIGLVMALKPLFDRFGLLSAHVVTMQAVSGAGYPGVASLDILDNVVPYIADEEEKVETEPLKILGSYDPTAGFLPAQFSLSAQCNRVPVVDGHMLCISIALNKNVAKEELIAAWTQFRAEPQELRLPSAPEHPLHYLNEEKYPQPKLHRLADRGMAVSIGRLRPCPLFDYKFVLLSHNTIRGAAGGSLLIGELLAKKGYLYW